MASGDFDNMLEMHSLITRTFVKITRYAKLQMRPMLAA